MRKTSLIKYLAGLIVVFILATGIVAQTATATLSGTVVDEAGAFVPGATVKISNTSTGFERTAQTDSEGYFNIPLLPPSTYVVTIERDGFSPVEVSNVVLNLGDRKGLRIKLKIGQRTDTVDVVADPVLVNETAAVRTVVDSELVKETPLNGRNIQTLISLAPGIVPVTQGNSEGQFVVNGQRPNANVFLVDGVSANFGAPRFANLDNFSNFATGSLPATNVLGGFTNQASVDAIDEIQVQTSTYSAEHGRSPGGQIIINTKSGKNEFHGSLYEYFRNDALDANDYFFNALGAGKAKLRFNNFGGTVGGPLPFLNFGEGVPIFNDGKDRTHFFFSYEGQRFVLPQAPIDTTSPTEAARQALSTEVARSAYAIFPLPNRETILDANGNPTDVGRLVRGYSDPNNSDSYSLRIDHNYKNKYTFFGRYNWAPADSATNGGFGVSSRQSFSKTRLFTLGATQLFGSKAVNEFRFNWSRQESGIDNTYDLGATPPIVETFFQGGELPAGSVSISFWNGAFGPAQFFENITLGKEADNSTQQLNVVDNFTYTAGKHQIRAGADFRFLRPKLGFGQRTFFQVTVPTILDGPNPVTDQGIFQEGSGKAVKTNQYSLYLQDTWRVNERLTTTFGVRWEINPPPTTAGARNVTLAAVPDLSKFDQNDLELVYDKAFYDTSYTNFAPRFGITYRLSDKLGRETIIRGGAGMFYDLGQEGHTVTVFPFTLSEFFRGRSLPIAFPQFAELPDEVGPFSPIGNVSVADGDFVTPRTYQFNLHVDQSLGKNNVLSVGYVGALGRKLIKPIRTAFGFFSPYFNNNGIFGTTIVTNSGESDYHALQTQFTSRYTDRFSAVVSYTWSHSIDNASTNENARGEQGIHAIDAFRADSSFDIRHNISGAFTYKLPAPRWNKFANAILGGWSFNSVFTARTGSPFNPIVRFFDTATRTDRFQRPNLTGEPIWIIDDSIPAGRRLNLDAFDVTNLPADPLVHGALGRNSLRGLGAWQVDSSIHRNFGFWEGKKLQLRLEAFNVFNHPNFASVPAELRITTVPDGRVFVSPTFGQFNSTLSRARTLGGFGLNSLFSVGGPRSIQLVARFEF